MREMKSACRVTQSKQRRTAEDAPPPFPVYRFSVDEYHMLMDVGIFKSGDPYELLDGWIVPKMTILPPHNQAVRMLSRRLNRLLDDSWVLQTQGATTLPPHDEPEPDFVVAYGPEARYKSVNPGPKDTLVIVEISDASLTDDRGRKHLIYARARIPIYWIVNLIDRQIEVYSQPRRGKNPTYLKEQVYGPANLLPLILAGTHIADIPVKDLLP